MEQEIIKIVAELAERETGEIGADFVFTDTEHWSSLLQLVLISTVEERFSVEIPLEDIPEIHTPGDLLKYL